MAQAKKSTTEPIIWIWSGIDKKGKKLKGELQSANASLAKAELRRQGIKVGNIKKKPKPLFGGAGKPITPQDIAIFSRQLATMLASGVPLVQSFDIIGGGAENPNFKDMIFGLRAEIEGGSTLSEALTKYPLQFDSLYINLVQAGEQAGVLDTLLDTIATYKERIEELKGKIKKALFYPAMVLIVAVVVSAILLIFVVPQFQSVFENFGADLPAFTMMVIHLSEFLQENGFLVAVATGAIIYALIQAKKRSKKVQIMIDMYSLKLPVIGDILNQAAIARFSRTLATTFAAGVPLVEALDTVAGATGNIVYEQATRKIQDDVSSGLQLQLAMRQVNLFPHLVISMASIGEEAGSLDQMLTKVAEFYENEVNNAVDALSSLLEPMIMVIIGGLVGSLVVAMYLPIFKLGAVV